MQNGKFNGNSIPITHQLFNNELDTNANYFIKIRQQLLELFN